MNMINQNSFPLVVDLDGTLIKTDILMEQVIAFVRLNPLHFILILIWFFQGFAKLKYEVYRRTNLIAERLPLNNEVIALINDAKSSGRKIILATASFLENANQVAKSINLFDEVLATTVDFNLRGKNKAKILVQKFGDKQFDYVGDSFIDIEVWKHSQTAYLVNPTQDLVDRVSKITTAVVLTTPTNKKIALAIKSIRIKQWIKNLLLFVPALLAHQTSIPIFFELFLAFLAFSFLSSAVYLLNDLNDLDNDRTHPIKKNRPMAAGDLHLTTGLYLSFFLLFLSIIFNLALNNLYFSIISILYLILNYFYSKTFKKLPIIDIVVLSFFYIIRIYAGGIVSETSISEWLIMFSIFTFISLAILKRYSEIVLIDDDNLSIRGYSSKDKSILMVFGITLSLLSSVIYLFYTQSDKVNQLYSEPMYLIYIAPLIIFFYLKLWLKINRKLENDNPFDIIVFDKVNYLLLAAALIFLYLAI